VATEANRILGSGFSVAFPVGWVQVFKAAQKLGGCIIFLDELDSLGANRENADSHEASRRLLSVLLREVDGFETSERRSIVIGATNRKQDLDAALLSR